MVDPKKTYAAAVRTLRQRVTGRSNDIGTARKPVATTEIKGVLTTAINQQKVIQSTLVVPQSREQRNQKLREALYKVFKVKQPPAAPEVKRTPVKPAEPLEIKTIFASGHRHIYGVNREEGRKPGHRTVPPVPQPPHVHTHVPTPVHAPPQPQPQDIPLPPSSPMSVDGPDYSDPHYHVPLPLTPPVPAIADDDWPITRPATPAGSPGAHALIPRPASPTALATAARGQHLEALRGQLADLFGVPLPLHPSA